MSPGDTIMIGDQLYVAVPINPMAFQQLQNKNIKTPNNGNMNLIQPEKGDAASGQNSLDIGLIKAPPTAAVNAPHTANEIRAIQQNGVQLNSNLLLNTWENSALKQLSTQICHR